MNNRAICKGCFNTFRPKDRRVKYCSTQCKRLSDWEWKEARLLDLGADDSELEKHRRRHPRYSRKRRLSIADKADMRAYQESMASLREERRKKSQDTTINLERLIERDGGTCYICGGKTSERNTKGLGQAWRLDNNYPTIDHVIPLSRDGSHTWDNVKLAHWGCNMEKGGSLLKQS